MSEYFNEFIWNAVDATMSIISTIVSLVMVCFTYRTIQTNNRQFNQLKRQWEEEHRPFIFFSTKLRRGILYLEIKNNGPVQADKIKISIEDSFFKKLENYKFFIDNDIKQFSTNSNSKSLCLQSKGVLRFKISTAHGENIVACMKDFSFKIDCEYDKYKETIVLYINQTINDKRAIDFE